MHSPKTRRLVETALMIALGMILSMIIIFRLPFGGSITLCGMLPLILIACRYGTKWGLFAGFITGILQTFQGAAEGTFSAAALGAVDGVYDGGFFQGSLFLAVIGIIVLDYLVAFTVIGFAGVFRDRFAARPAVGVVCGTLFAGVLRYLVHVISGAIFFGIWGEWFFTQEGFFSWGEQIVNAFPGKSLYLIYSLIYNAFFLVPEILITAVAAFLIVKAAPGILTPKEQK